ncbi:hypothetical protein [Bradyrhizobium pachyrhizi]|uniref:hypothetical protein n=1 Tax=Bradyrhizobium pachyrhizi TaxID=280333 RepID=UPI000ABF6923|nr:hypothetical protein [Bradyrhizobium pachyrhizi]
MRSRWTILAALFVARATIAFQFQSVAAIAPQLSQGLGASLADIGALIGLYFAPGALLPCLAARSAAAMATRWWSLPVS